MEKKIHSFLILKDLHQRDVVINVAHIVSIRKAGTGAKLTLSHGDEVEVVDNIHLIVSDLRNNGDVWQV